MENGIERIDGNWKFGYGGYLFEVGDIGSSSFELSEIAVIHLIQLEVKSSQGERGGDWRWI